MIALVLEMWMASLTFGGTVMQIHVCFGTLEIMSLLAFESQILR